MRTLASIALILAVSVMLNPSCAKASNRFDSVRPKAMTADTEVEIERILARVEAQSNSLDARELRDLFRENLWSIYPLGDAARSVLEKQVRERPEGAGLAFAGMALISFRDKASVEVIARRIHDPGISTVSRWWLMSSLPILAGMGDCFAPGTGALDDSARQFVLSVHKHVDGVSVEIEATKATSFGNAHARAVRAALDAVDSGNASPGGGMVLWHYSAYLGGTLDLGDFELLLPLVDPKYDLAYLNLAQALCLTAGRDFFADLRGRENITPEDQEELASSIRKWWRQHLVEHPGGDWRVAAVEGLASSGYSLEGNLRSPASTVELLRALDSNEYVSYAAARLLNEVYDTNFDLQFVYVGGKFALSILDSDPLAPQKVRLRDYWNQRLKPKGSKG